VSDNVRLIQTVSDLFSLKVLGEMLGEFERFANISVPASV